jgi:NAD(P)-dependent dehydrogenase (short-subunit alcohol dehydrogenase family)
MNDSLCLLHFIFIFGEGVPLLGDLKLTTKKELAGKCALVSGATRGAGRAIAVSLAQAGAYVYATGRSSRTYGPSSIGRPETIEETEEMIRATGGEGQSVRVDHMDFALVGKLIDKINKEKGKLDILVNDIWGGESVVDWSKPFWEQDVTTQMSMFMNAIVTHINTTVKAIHLLMKSEKALIVEITDGVGYHYRGNLFYSLVKITTNHLALAYAEDLKERGFDRIISIGLTPGFLRSEQMLDLFGVSEENWRDAIKSHPDFAGSETPYYIGRALVSLISDPNFQRFNGQTLSTWGLSKIYDFREKDGSRPDWENFHKLYKEGKINPLKWEY